MTNQCRHCKREITLTDGHWVDATKDPRFCPFAIRYQHAPLPIDWQVGDKGIWEYPLSEPREVERVGPCDQLFHPLGDHWHFADGRFENDFANDHIRRAARSDLDVSPPA